VFPLLYNFPFLLGFYNFSLGVALLLPGVSWWIRKQEIQLSNRQWIVVCCWAGLLYFSHIVVFLLGIGLAGLVTLFRNDQRTLKVKAALVFRLLLALLPWLVLTATYLLKSGNAGFRGGVVYLPLEELFSDLCKARMLIAYEEQQESLFTGLYAQFVLLMLMLAFLKRSVAVFARVGILNFIVACLLYGLMPDSVAGGGILSVRLLLWLYVSALILLVALRLPDRYARSGAWISLATSLLLAYIHAPIQVHLNRDAKAFIAAAGSIPYHGCVLPLNYSGNWMHSNFPSYLGACSGALVWDNYEANEGVFPLQWKQGMNPELHLGNHVSSSRPCVDIAASNRVTGLPLTHVLIWKRRDVPPDSCSMDVQHQLDAGFTRIRSEDPMVFSSITNSGKQ
jgi:hypothetical protein